MNHKPLLSVILTSFNSEQFIAETINSILNQTFSDFELLICDDGSQDKTIDILESFKDNRISLFRNNENKGVVFSRNFLLDKVSGEYIAFCDSDDIQHIHKFQHQIDFLQTNSSIDLLGCNAKLIDSEGILLGKWKLNAPSKQIPSIMLFRNYFVHSAMLIRTKALKNIRYEIEFEVIEDYRLWMKLIFGGNSFNLPNYLVSYRIHEKNVTNTKSVRMQTLISQLAREYLLEIGVDVTDKILYFHELIRNEKSITRKSQLLGINDLLIEILERNRISNVYNSETLKKTTLNRWLKIISKTKKLSLLPYSIILLLKLLRA